MLSYKGKLFTVCTLGALLLSQCGLIEKSSRHDFQSGVYRMAGFTSQAKRVYVESTPENVQVFPAVQPDADHPLLSIPLQRNDSLCLYPVSFSRVSIDLDLTTLPFKYRFAQSGLPAQLSTEFNAALYAGRRFDRYTVRSRKSPLGSCSYEVLNRGFDFGVFAGMGGTPITPFTTRNVLAAEYNAPVIQGGIAFFLESDVASFGLAAGMDHLLGRDRDVWVYNRKPWLGFIIGLALN